MTNKPLKLFFLRYKEGGGYVLDTLTGQPVHFDNKKTAKKHRENTMCITYGVDHNKFKGGLK
tara:strand:- start:3937 stop:4122 length:186 start_codon:yes stop_codon:yes gene_type:complete